ncbi:MAG: methylenetetrahydrofolate reductase [Neomegalonema sp.]|nr:methylenetetrahydrofolate reductase [Neomegalonema sp.]
MSNVVSLPGLASMRDRSATSAELGRFLSGYSIEVLPKVAAKVDDFGALLPAGTQVFVAHIAGSPVADVAATVRRLSEAGFKATPHVPARTVRDRDELDDRLARYAAAGACSALAIAGGLDHPMGDYTDSMQLLETGLFDRHGFGDIAVAGHPEGARDIDPDGSTDRVDAALRWKMAFAERTDAQISIATQFLFDPEPAIRWSEALAAAGIAAPIRLGVAGPAKLSTLIKYAVTCGVGPSLRVLKRRAADMTQLLTSFEPTEMLLRIAAHKADNPGSMIVGAHFFPLGGFAKAAEWANDRIAEGMDAAAITA